MVDSPLLTKSKAFALDIIRVCNEIKRSQKESHHNRKFLCKNCTTKKLRYRVLRLKTRQN